MHTVTISIALSTPVVIVEQFKHWPIFSINCGADKAAELVLPICRDWQSCNLARQAINRLHQTPLGDRSAWLIDRSPQMESTACIISY